VFFAGFDFAGRAGEAGGGRPHGRVYGLVTAYREFGHLIARIDPLGGSPTSHPLLELATVGLDEAELDHEVDAAPFQGEFAGTLRELIAILRETYCGTIGVEYMEIPDHAQREWLQQQMEGRRNHPSLAPVDRMRILRDLRLADAFEQFLHVKYVGQKRFSLEGAATLIPMLAALAEGATAIGVEQLVIGMPHRGRLNVLANVIGKPRETIFGEFESSFVPEEVQGHGDVKYHLGFSGIHRARDGRTIHLNLHFNPSHLEFVNPVVLGSMRARQTLMNDPAGERGVPVLIHGDASFAGEGIVPETLTLAQLPHYRTGGTVHIVVNNQIGFTTSPEDGRPTRYPTDVARSVQSPVFHVNGDDPEAAVHAIQLALAYRARFHRDAFVDLVCYRKHGHNEMDDPTFTQPVLYESIRAHVPVSQRYAERLIGEGVLDKSGLEAMDAEIDGLLRDAHARTRSAPTTAAAPAKPGGAWEGLDWSGDDWSADTGVARERIDRVIDTVTRFPDGFTPHRKIAQLAEERRRMVGEDRIDWGLGETLAYGTLLLEGSAVRLSGQDTSRGTFSHRHVLVRDAGSGEAYVPLQRLAEGQGRFEVIDTMLSEAAVLGFEYGYSVADPNTLIVWEAQFGDFSNVAQVYIDQFLASAETKWRRMSGLVLMLPHGYEGQGPEHSSARLERFLELCANGNLQVCNLTTPAQLFHALRRQLHRRFRKPLVLMSPKSLLRHKQAVSPMEAFTDGAFETVLDDADVARPDAVRRVLLTSGKLYYTLCDARAERGAVETAIVRIEQLYPFPSRELARVLERYPNARDMRWVQEEPANMGAWRHTRHRLETTLREGSTLVMAARRASASPATGYYMKHVEQERELLERAFMPMDGAEMFDDTVPRAPRHAKSGREVAR
jgi:2-oxoglutarate dehydrogenase E1 component